MTRQLHPAAAGQKTSALSMALVLILAACQAAPPTALPTTAPPSAVPTTAPPTAEPSPTTITLEIAGPAGSKTLTLDEVRALPAVQG